MSLITKENGGATAETEGLLRSAVERTRLYSLNRAGIDRTTPVKTN